MLKYTFPFYVKIYTPHSPLMLKYTLPTPLIQNLIKKNSLPSPQRSLNYIPLPSYVKIYTLSLNIFFISNNLAKKKNKI